MRPLFKWPGGKTAELPIIRPLVPDFDRYVEPFMGGGAVFFDLEPSHALVADVSPTLTNLYRHIATDAAALSACLNELNDARDAVAALATRLVDDVLRDRASLTAATQRDTVDRTVEWFSARRSDTDILAAAAGPYATLVECLPSSVGDKLNRISVHETRTGAWSAADLREQITTAFHAALYLAVRCSRPEPGSPRASATFAYLRAFAYGGMFRFNRAGEFNVPYGGRSYNGTSFRAKAARYTAPDVVALMARTDVRCGDFEAIVSECRPGDFVFVDPPYDTAFSGYDGFAFTSEDQRRLATALTGADFTFMMIVGKSPLTEALYGEAAAADRSITVTEYAKTYRYNVRGRNARDAVHLLVRNY